MVMKLKMLALAVMLASANGWATDDAFDKALSEAGASADAIKVLKDNEINSLDDLKKLDVDKLLKIGVKMGSAQKIVDKFGEKKVENVATDKMSVEELLKHLAANPKDEKALSSLKENSLVQEAEQKAQTARWAAMGDDKKLDSAATVAYLNYLKKGGKRDTSFKGKSLKSIDVALGNTEESVWYHPLFENEQIVDGMHSDLDWSAVDQELLKALLWARNIKHKDFPQSPDAFQIHEKALIKPLADPRLKKILADFKLALEEDEANAKATSLKKKL
jgi:G:T/U-mismatch repair DNA glycosylase